MNAYTNNAALLDGATALATPVTVACGDGIGPEIMQAALRVLEEGGARLAPEMIEIGEAVYRRGITAGIEDSAWASLKRTGIFFKAPITTPQGGGYKSLNVTVRKTMGLFANVRPVESFHPFIATRHPGMDVVIVRENEEDLYAGIEHRQTHDVYQCLKVMTRPGTERLVRYAFEYARAHGRKKVTCMTKDNIMKMTDGMFHAVFDEIGRDYPELAKEHMIIDIGAARLANDPARFDVIVLPNLYGDILSDIAAEIAGSVGIAGSANVGDTIAMFEAIHGSAPDIAGKDIANPSGLILSGVMMLNHIGQHEAATRIHNAWLRTIEDGIHTGDIFREGVSSSRVGTQDFAQAVIARLGKTPLKRPAVAYGSNKLVSQTKPTAKAVSAPIAPRHFEEKKLVGTDIFVHRANIRPADLARIVKSALIGGETLAMITNRGVKVWPAGMDETMCVDHWRCRVMFDAHIAGNGWMVAQLLTRLCKTGLDVVKTENLYTFDGTPGYSLGQGQ